MLFVTAKLVWLVLQPGSILLLLGLVGLPFAWRGARLGLALVTVSLGGFTAILLLPLHQWLLLPLENRFPPPGQPPAQVSGIILLGGAQEVELTEARGQPSFDAKMETMTAFVALARQYPDATLAFAGGSGAIAGARLSEADVSRALFDQLGLTRPVIYEAASRDTYENALLLKQAVRPVPGGTWLLVTSASHMPRSVGCFREAGWPVLAWPVAFKSADALGVQFRQGLGERLSELGMALHEWVGLIAYRALGRTDALFPKPAGAP